MSFAYRAKAQRLITTLLEARMQVFLTILEAIMTRNIITILATIITQAEMLRVVLLLVTHHPVILATAMARWTSLHALVINDAANAITVTIIIIAAMNIMLQRSFTESCAFSYSLLFCSISDHTPWTLWTPRVSTSLSEITGLSGLLREMGRL